MTKQKVVIYNGSVHIQTNTRAKEERAVVQARQGNDKKSTGQRDEVCSQTERA
jgi:hypothetical protein